MRQETVLRHVNVEQHYARVESVILDLQLSISSVGRANGCLDLETVQRVRKSAAATLGHSDTTLAEMPTDPLQARRVADRRRALARMLQEPSPIESLARTLHVG